jgi:outer membrane murein-binding lipoprotein Lpp
MVIAPNTSHKNGPGRYVIFAVVGWLWVTGCAAKTSGLKQEVEVLLRQTMDQVRRETRRMDTEIAQLRSEVVRLRSEVKQVDSKVGQFGSDVGQLGTEVALLQTDVHRNDASLVDMAVRVNQLDRRLAKGERQALQNGAWTSRPADARGRLGGRPVATAAGFSPRAVPSAREDTTKALKQGMSQQEVLRMFGNPHGTEKILDSVYWYYADGELKGQYVRFDATTGDVNGWSTFSPQYFQIDLRTTQGGHVR